MDLDTASIEDISKYSEENARSVVVIVSTWSALRKTVLPMRQLGSTNDVRVRILEELVSSSLIPAVWPGIAGRLIEFTCKSDPDDGTTVRLRLSRPSPLHSLVGFLVAPQPSILTPPLRLALTHRDLEPFAIGSPSVRYAGVNDVVQAGGVSVPLTDVALSAAFDGELPGTVDRSDAFRPRVVVASRQAAATSPPVPSVCFPPVDTVVVNPTGLEVSVGGEWGRVVVAGDGWGVIGNAARQPVRVAPNADLSRTDIDRLREYEYLVWEGESRETSHTDARLVCQLAAAGIPIVASKLSIAVRDLLGGEMTAVLDATRAADMKDPLLREAASIRLRRTALRHHGSGPRLRQLGRLARHSIAPEPTVSVILMTKRPQMVAAALQQLSAQTYPQVQLVLGLHGDAFDEASIAAAVETVPMPSVIVRVPADVAFGEALNLATERCDGRLVSKWDDDDLYGSEHIWDLVLAADYSGATVVGKVAEFTLVTEAATTVRRSSRGSERFTSHIAGGTITLRRETLQAIGGWRPQPRYVDDALLRQLRDAGGTVYRTHGFGYVLVRHDQGHTWDPGTPYFLQGDTPRWPSTSPLQQVALEQVWVPGNQFSTR